MSDDDARIRAWRGFWRSHGYSAASALGRFVRSPFSHVLTLGVIAIALSLPALGYIGLMNLRLLSGTLKEPADVNLFLKMPATAAEVAELRREVASLPGIRKAEIKSPDEALAEFRELTQFSDALAAFDGNPLPYLITVKLEPDLVQIGDVDALTRRLREHPGIDSVQFDRDWVVRLQAILALGERAVLLVGGLLALAVLLVIGNTIRLEIGQRRDEIVIVKLVGASDAFVRRPFLYSGFWFGMFGGILAVAMIALSVALLAPAVVQLAEAYAGNFVLRGLGLAGSAVVLGLGVGLGLLGAYLASLRHLAEAEPQ